MAKTTAQFGLRVVGLDRENKINGFNLVSPADDNRSFVTTEARNVSSCACLPFRDRPGMSVRATAAVQRA
jgi:hypothetical protein